MIATPIPRETLLHVVRKLPAAPHILAQLDELLSDTNSDMSDITALLKCDMALTARIIRISNSAFYNSGKPYASLEESLARVGFNESYRLAGLAAVAQMSDYALKFYGITGPRLRENSLLTALVMEALSGFANVDPRMAYTAGLLRSVGKIALDRLTRDTAYAGNHDGREQGGLAAWETGVIGLNNCEASAVILSEWRFPTTTIAAIRDHFLLNPGAGLLANLLNLAAGAAERGDHGLPGETVYWEPSLARFEAAGVQPENVDEAMWRALKLFGALRSAVS
jgi:HD-like signal output (HDOD) protein